MYGAAPTQYLVKTLLSELESMCCKGDGGFLNESLLVRKLLHTHIHNNGQSIRRKPLSSLLDPGLRKKGLRPSFNEKQSCIS